MHSAQRRGQAPGAGGVCPDRGLPIVMAPHVSDHPTAARHRQRDTSSGRKDDGHVRFDCVQRLACSEVPPPSTCGRGGWGSRHASGMHGWSARRPSPRGAGQSRRAFLEMLAVPSPQPRRRPSEVVVFPDVMCRLQRRRTGGWGLSVGRGHRQFAQSRFTAPSNGMSIWFTEAADPQRAALGASVELALACCRDVASDEDVLGRSQGNLGCEDGTETRRESRTCRQAMCRH